MKLSIKGFGLAGAVLFSVVLFLWTLLVALTGTEYSRQTLTLFADFYPYFDISVAGAFVGLVYGFVDGFVMHAVFAWLYNKFAS